MVRAPFVLLPRLRYLRCSNSPVSKPASFEFASVRACLLHIINICLEADPSLVPAGTLDEETGSADGDAPSADDFRFWSEKQAKRISKSIMEAFGVEYSYEVILADANVTTLTNRILATKELLE